VFAGLLFWFWSAGFLASQTPDWIARYHGPGNGDDELSAIAVDGQGNVYVTGSSYGIDTAFDYATIKYNAQGNQVWEARYNGPGNRNDWARALAVDSQGNAYVTGSSEGVGSLTEYATIKYNPAGKEVWVARYRGHDLGPSEAAALAIDAQGNVYV